MSVANLFNVPSNDQEMAAWSALHMIQHRLSNYAALQNKGIALPEYVLDPVNLADPQAFLNQHQSMHSALDELYDVPGFDLTSVDWSDEGQRAGWIFLNATLHVAEAEATGAF